ncbi:MAG: peptidase [Caldithrix sp. RBG_13_44_9]|nr:MAG: peptidase [Caldithrix sp. RBG_13_44_9]
MLREQLAKFVPTEISYDTSLLTEKETVVLEKLYQAGKIMDEIFLKQVYSRNEEILAELQKSRAETDQLRLQLFHIMFGPFNRLDHNNPFYGNGAKPAGADFYPEDMTKEEFLKWIENHPEDKESFTSEFTVIRREGDKLLAIPYSQYFKEELTSAATYLREAANYADNPSLQKYLLSRADAFLSNDYYQSDKDWMDLKDHTIEVVIGPYEVYEDELFNYKASFEAFITLRDPAESHKLARFGGYLLDIERNLPIPEEYKNFKRGSESPIVVAQEVFSAGDTKAGVQTIAFTLPNDERVRAEKGSKKVMLKNVNEAKFNQILLPIAARVLDGSQLQDVTFEAFFNHVLMHEMSHGVGPGFITVDGEQTEVKKELKETYSTMEECKADILGMYNIIFLMKKGEFPASFENETWSTFLAGIFRSVRFGITEAHGAGCTIIYNYLLEKGGYEYDQAALKVRVNIKKIYPALEELAAKILTIQAEGNYEGAKQIIAAYAVESSSMTALKAKLTGLPVDIRPVFQIEKIMQNK